MITEVLPIESPDMGVVTPEGNDSALAKCMQAILDKLHGYKQPGQRISVSIPGLGGDQASCERTLQSMVMEHGDNALNVLEALNARLPHPIVRNSTLERIPKGAEPWRKM